MTSHQKSFQKNTNKERNKIMRKAIRKLAAVLMATMMIMVVGISSFAADSYTITIKKSDKDTATHTYTAYRVFTGNKTQDSNDPTKYYLTAIEWGDGVDSDFFTKLKEIPEFATCTTASDVATVLETYASPETFAALAAEHLGTAAGTSGPVTTDTATITVEGYGYYLIVDEIDPANGAEGAVSQHMLKVVDMHTADEIRAKDVVPSIGKVIVENNTEVQANNARIGDSIHFRIKSTVPDLTNAGYNGYWFVISDTLCKGFTLDNSTPMVITIGTGSNMKTLNTSEYSLSTKSSNGETELDIEIKEFLSYATNAAYINSPITIDYYATLNSECDITVEGNANSVYLTYSNDPSADYSGNYDPNGPVGKTPEAITKTYTTGIVVIKVDTDGNRLSGAEFQFELEGSSINQVVVLTEKYVLDPNGEYYKLKDGSFTKDDPATHQTLEYESTTDTYSLTVERTVETVTSSNTITATTDAQGYIAFGGLGTGSFYITETNAPAGYNRDTSTHKVVIGTSGAPTLTDPKWTFNGTAGTDPIEVVITNVKTTNLPGTGGMGTTVIYIAGAVLVAAGAGLFVFKKKTGAEKTR